MESFTVHSVIKIENGYKQMFERRLSNLAESNFMRENYARPANLDNRKNLGAILRIANILYFEQYKRH